jgi:hypothetical protein
MDEKQIREKLKKVEEYLTKENSFELFRRNMHTSGVNSQTVTLDSGYNPYDEDVYIIAVGLNAIYGYTLKKPYNLHDWQRRWEKRYKTKTELIEILKEETTIDTCW